MIFNFANGTQRQQDLWREAIDRLLNFPSSAIPLTIAVEFLDPSELKGGHTDLAETTWTYGSTNASTVIRNDAPSFGDQQKVMEAYAASLGIAYSIEKFYAESSAHELGHALFAALPQPKRVAIAELFGASSDSLEELAPEGSDWQDRIIEGIAETFKEAFLPRRFRLFPNRTRRTIAYRDFPAFRAIFREAMPETGAGTLEPGETEVPGFGPADLFAIGEPFLKPGEVVANYLAGIGGKHGIWSTNFFNLEQGPLLHNSQLLSFSDFDGVYIKDGTILSYSFTLNPAFFLGTPYFVAEALQQYNDAGINFRLLGRKSAGGSPFIIHSAGWAKTVMPDEIVEAFGGQPVGGYGLYEEAIGGGAPTTTFSRSFTVNAAKFPKFVKCNGHIYRYVGLQASVGFNFPSQFPETDAEQENLRQQVMYPWIPSLVFSQGGCPEGEGQEVIVPAPSVTPEGFLRGSRPKRHAVMGSSR